MGPDVVVLATAAAVAARVAARVAEIVAASPSLTLGLAAGQTFVPVYAALRRLQQDGAVQFGGLTTFNLDEFVGLNGHDPHSFRRFMDDHLFAGAGFTPARIHAPDGRADDIEEECRRYDAAVGATGGIDLQLLGIGVNGHIGFNEPGLSLDGRCHRVALREETRAANARPFGRTEDVPAEAITLGMTAILQSRAIVLVATGASKAAPVAAALTGPITSQVPASLLQTHRAVAVFLDEAAATGL